MFFLIICFHGVLEKYFICFPSKSCSWCFMALSGNILRNVLCLQSHLLANINLFYGEESLILLFILDLFMSMILPIWLFSWEKLFLVGNLDSLQAISFL